MLFRNGCDATVRRQEDETVFLGWRGRTPGRLDDPVLFLTVAVVGGGAGGGGGLDRDGRVGLDRAGATGPPMIPPNRGVFLFGTAAPRPWEGTEAPPARAVVRGDGLASGARRPGRVFFATMGEAAAAFAWGTSVGPPVRGDGPRLFPFPFSAMSSAFREKCNYFPTVSSKADKLTHQRPPHSSLYRTRRKLPYSLPAQQTPPIRPRPRGPLQRQTLEECSCTRSL